MHTRTQRHPHGAVTGAIPMLTRIETDSIDLAAASPATADNQRKTQEALPLSWSASTDVLFPPPGVDRMTLTAARSSTTSSCMYTRTQRHPHGAVTGAIPMLTRIETYSIDLAAASQATADNQRKTQEALPLSWSASTDVLFPPSGHQLCTFNKQRHHRQHACKCMHMRTQRHPHGAVTGAIPMLTRIETDSIDLAAASQATADNQRKTQEALPLSWSASTDVLFPPPGINHVHSLSSRSTHTRTQRHPHGAVTGAIPMLTRIETYSIDLAAASQATADNQRKTQEALPLSWSASTDVLFPPSGHQLCACIQLSVNQTPAKQSSSRPAVIASNGRPASTAIVDLNTARRRHTAKLTHHRSECQWNSSRSRQERPANTTGIVNIGKQR